jgi:hypothetical protein
MKFSLKNEVATCQIGCVKIQILLSAKNHITAAVPRLLKTAIMLDIRRILVGQTG